MKVKKDKLIENINKKWITKKCPMCGENSWNISGDMVAIMPLGEDKSIQLGGKTMPAIPITCNNCGNIILINPLIINCIEE